MDSGKSELPHRSSSRLTVWVQPMLCRRSRWHYSVYSKSVELIELIMRLRLMHRQCVLLIIVFCKKRFFHVVNWSKKQKKKKRTRLLQWLQEKTKKNCNQLYWSSKFRWEFDLAKTAKSKYIWIIWSEYVPESPDKA